MSERKHLTRPERNIQSYISFIDGCKGAMVGAGIGLITSAISFRFSPAFRSLSRPYQSVMTVSGAFSGYMFASEHTAITYKNNVLGYVDHKTMDNRVLFSYKALPREPKEKAMRFINDHRWALLGATWATSMTGAYSYNFIVHKHLSLHQKMFHARIYAQCITLAALIASAALSLYVDENDKKILKDIPEGKLRAVLELPHLEQKKQLAI
ncbi:unnamed protein product [Mucor hiemalis]